MSSATTTTTRSPESKKPRVGYTDERCKEVDRLIVDSIRTNSSVKMDFLQHPCTIVGKGPFSLGSIPRSTLVNHRCLPSRPFGPGRFMFLPVTIPTCPTGYGGGGSVFGGGVGVGVGGKGEDVMLDVYQTGDPTNVHRIFCSMIDRKLSSRKDVEVRLDLANVGQLDNRTMMHLAEPLEEDDVAPPSSCKIPSTTPLPCRFSPGETTGVVECATRTVTSVKRICMGGGVQKWNPMGIGSKEPDAFICEAPTPHRPVLAFEVAYRNEGIQTILVTLSLWSHQFRTPLSPLSSRLSSIKADTSLAALAIHIADGPGNGIDGYNPAFAWASVEPRPRDQTAYNAHDHIHGVVQLINASPRYWLQWRQALDDPICPLRLALLGNVDCFVFPMYLLAPPPMASGEECTSGSSPEEQQQEQKRRRLSNGVQTAGSLSSCAPISEYEAVLPKWSFFDLLALYHEGKVLDDQARFTSMGQAPQPRLHWRSGRDVKRERFR